MKTIFKNLEKSSIEQLSTIGVLFMSSGTIFLTLFRENLAFTIASFACVAVGLVFTVLAFNKYFTADKEKNNQNKKTNK